MDNRMIENDHLQQIGKIPIICASLGMRNVIISPGSRSAPLTVAFSRCEKIVDRVVIDERSAAYIALGIAQQTNEPVGLICTSGTAALNYMPAIAEAYYQHIPLLVLTADRPPEWINQRDNQTIHQRNIYAAHSRGNFELPVDTRHSDAEWYLERILSEATNQTRSPISGPVHINIPLREPLYLSPEAFEKVDKQYAPKIIRCLETSTHLNDNVWLELQKTWKASKTILIVVGMKKVDAGLDELLQQLIEHENIVVIADITANIVQKSISIKYADIILESNNHDVLHRLVPELLISLGGQIVSKELKSFLRIKKPMNHWHIEENGEIVDTYQTLTTVIPVSPCYFLKKIIDETKATLDIDYTTMWRTLNDKVHNHLLSFIEKIPFCDFKAIAFILNKLPTDSYLQLGNSMAIRYANIVGSPENIPLKSINSNRGTSGIDGTMSTAVGVALSTDKITTLIIGDLAFFYDRNALWNEYLPTNLRIIIINNQGGGIFDLIDGPNQLSTEEKKRYFLTPQTLTAKSIAMDYHCNYSQCQTIDQLEIALDTFFEPSSSLSILEIRTKASANVDVWKSFKSILFI